MTCRRLIDQEMAYLRAAVRAHLLPRYKHLPDRPGAAAAACLRRGLVLRGGCRIHAGKSVCRGHREVRQHPRATHAAEKSSFFNGRIIIFCGRFIEEASFSIKESSFIYKTHQGSVREQVVCATSLVTRCARKTEEQRVQ